MTKWTYTKIDENTLQLTRQVEDKAPIVVGPTDPNLNNALVEIAEELEPGDWVTTPEGTSLVYPRQGWLEN